MASSATPPTSAARDARRAPGDSTARTAGSGRDGIAGRRGADRHRAAALRGRAAPGVVRLAVDERVADGHQREGVAHLPQCLGVAEQQVAALGQHVVERPDQRAGGRPVEVDRDVAADDQVDLAGRERRRLGDQVVQAQLDQRAGSVLDAQATGARLEPPVLHHRRRGLEGPAGVRRPAGRPQRGRRACRCRRCAPAPARRASARARASASPACTAPRRSSSRRSRWSAAGRDRQRGAAARAAPGGAAPPSAGRCGRSASPGP